MDFAKHIRKYQHIALKTALIKKRLAIFADMGLGKSIIALCALQGLKLLDPSLKTILIAPKQIAIHTWPTEIKDWNINLSYVRIDNQKKLKQSSKYDIAAIHSEYIFPYILPLAKERNCLIIDESTEFKNWQSKRFRTLKPLLKYFKYRFILSGTPMPKGYLDLFTQYYILSRSILGDSIGAYKRTFFNERICGYPPRQWREYTIKKEAPILINKLVEPYTIRLDKSLNVTMPEIIYQDLAISLDKKDQKIYDQLEQKLILEIGKEKKPIDNKSTNYIRCQQFANGIIYTNKSKSIEKIHNEKIKALQLLIDSLQGKNLLVAYWYKSDLKLLQDNFKNLAVYNSDDPTIVDKWNNGEIPLLVGQAKTISMGLNLQFGGHHICWFSLSNRADLFHQLNARLARPRQNETVFIYQIVCKDTIDEAIKKDTEKKEETQKKFLEYFERRWK